VFLDTNILVYAFDTSEPGKRARALELLTAVLERRTLIAVLSTQVLQEFYVTVVRKLARPLSALEAEEVVRNLTQLPVVQIDEGMVLDAIASSRSEQLSLWDALILEAARCGGCETLLTEDLQAERVYGGVTVSNPFAPI
jgi:predicted nucleic acid-binding protein